MADLTRTATNEVAEAKAADMDARADTAAPMCARTNRQASRLDASTCRAVSASARASASVTRRAMPATIVKDMLDSVVER